MKRKLTTTIIFLIVFIPLAYFFLRNSIDKTNAVLEALYKEYPNIGYHEKLEGKVTDCYQGDLKYLRNSKHAIFVTLNDTVKRYLLTGYEFDGELLLQDVVNVGSYLIKEPNTYNLTIQSHSNGQVRDYHFKLIYNNL